MFSRRLENCNDEKMIIFLIAKTKHVYQTLMKVKVTCFLCIYYCIYILRYVFFKQLTLE